MTATTQARVTETYGANRKQYSLGMASGAVGYKNAIAMKDTAGRAVDGAATSTLVAMGVFLATYDNSAGGADAMTAQITSGAFKFANGDSIAAADVPCIVYVVDNQTVAKSSSGGTRPVAGIAFQVDSDGVRVDMSPELSTVLSATAGSTIAIASKAIGHADLTAGATTQTINFGAALPANALILGGGANVTTAFNNAGNTDTTTFDLGFAGTNVIVNGGSLNSIAKVSTPAGGSPTGLVGALTPSVKVNSSVNVNTITKGAAVFYVAYLGAF